jgi:hypothetical protein
MGTTSGAVGMAERGTEVQNVGNGPRSPFPFPETDRADSVALATLSFRCAVTPTRNKMSFPSCALSSEMLKHPIISPRIMTNLYGKPTNGGFFPYRIGYEALYPQTTCARLGIGKSTAPFGFRICRLKDRKRSQYSVRAWMAAAPTML